MNSALSSARECDMDWGFSLAAVTFWNYIYTVHGAGPLRLLCICEYCLGNWVGVLLERASLPCEGKLINRKLD